MFTYTSFVLALCYLSIVLCDEPTTAIPPEENKSTEVSILPSLSFLPTSLLKTAAVVVGLSLALVASLYIPAIIYRLCYMLGGCQPVDGRLRRNDAIQDMIAAQLGIPRNIKNRGKRDVYFGPVLTGLAGAIEKYKD